MRSATGTNSAVSSDSVQRSEPVLQKVRSVSAVEGHARWAQTYDLTPNPLLALEERILESLLPDLRSQYVMDVACGTGRWLRRLKARGAAGGLGIDLSAEMLAQAARKPAMQGTLVRGDAHALPFRSGVADLLISSFSVGYIDDLQGFAGESARVTRQGGIIVVTDFHPSNHSRRWRRTFRLGSEVFEIRSFSRPLVALCNVFEACGLTLEACLEPCFGEPERHFFDRCGRGHFFEEARSGPAIFVCIFKKGTTISMPGF